MSGFISFISFISLWCNLGS